MTRLLRNLLLASTLLLTTYHLSAQDLYWVGSGNNWNNAINWSFTPNGTGGAGVPNANSVVYIGPSTTAIHIELPNQAHCHSLTCEGDVTLHGSGSVIELEGNMLFSGQARFAGEVDVNLDLFETVHFQFEHVQEADFSLVGPGMAEFDSHLLLAPQNSFLVDRSTIDFHGFALSCGSFQVIDSHSSLNVAGAKIIINEDIYVHQNVSVLQSEAPVWIADGVNESNVNAGPLAVTFPAARTNTCGTDPGQTPFTIDAVVLSDYNGEDVSCNGAADGETFVTVAGGIGPFTYQWLGGDAPAFTQNYSGLSAGTYTVLVTDLGQGITCVDNVGVTEPPQLTVFTFSYTPPTCSDVCDGSGTPVVGGGVPGYNFTWSTGESTQSSTMLCEGGNTLTIEDQNLCTIDTTFVIDLAPLVMNLSVTNVDCFGESTGSASAAPSGANGGPFTLDWSTGDSGNSINNQPAGIYTLTVTDNAGCERDTTFEITQELEILITEDLNEPTTCNGATDGALEITPSGGQGPYSTDWTGPNGFTSTDEDISNLEAGVYDVTVTDNLGCEQTASFTITEPDPIDIAAVSTPTNCFGASNGSIDITVTGGTPGYTYAWTGPNGYTSTDEDINGLEAGTYTIVVTDSNDCTASLDVDVLSPDPIVDDAVVTDISCFGEDDGSIELTPTGGTPNYTFVWTGPNGFVSGDEDIFDLEAGTYDLMMVDAQGCIANFSYDIIEPGELDVFFTVTQISCNGADDGALESNVTGGVAPFDYDWSSPNGFSSTLEDVTDLAPGVYTLVVTDASGCQASQAVNIVEPSAIIINANVTDVSCGGLFDGEIDASASGGTPALTYSWTGPNGFTSIQLDITGLEAGDYTLEVTDANDCVESMLFTVNEPDEILATFDITPLTCNGADDAAIDLTLTGGTAPYITNWVGPNGFTGSAEDLAGLEPGIYDLTVTDDNGCQIFESVEITEPDVITFTVDTTDPLCNGDLTGEIILTIAGGVPPYTVNWDSGDVGETINGLAAGDYVGTIEDSTGCIATTGTITINEPTEIDASAVITDITCNGFNDGAIDVTVSGGTPGYLYDWTGPNGFTSIDEDLTALEPGTYDLQVTDLAGCIADFSFDVGEPDELTLAASITNLACATDLGAIDLTITGGTAPYDVSWTGPFGFTSTDEDITDLNAGLYDVEVTDANGCLATETYEVTTANPILIDATTSDLDCTGGNNGSIELDVMGGTLPLNFAWTGPMGYTSTDEDIFGLAAGTYDLTITDDNGCEETASYTLIQPDDLDATATITGPVCAGEFSGTIDVELTGGDEIYTYSWTGPNGFMSADEDLTGLEPGDYDLHAEDGGSCTLDITFTVPVTDPVILTGNATSIDCFGDFTGTIEVDASGGVPPYNFDWTGPNGFTSTDEDLSGLEAGDYDLIMTDDNGCQTPLSVTVTQEDELIVDTNTTTATCDEPDGTAEAIVSGGNGPYVISWFDGDMNFISNNALIEDLFSGPYTVIVQDALGCEVTVDEFVDNTDIVNLTGTVTDVLCFGDFNGAIELDATGGTGGFLFDWVGPNGFTSTDEDISDLEAGTYTVTVTDAVGCEVSEDFDVNEPNELLATETISDIECNGAASGSIELEVSGGTPNYIFDWVGPDGFTSVDEDIFDLEGGTYDVIITDDNGCTFIASYDVDEAPAFDVTIDFTAFLCFGETGGTIDLTLSGGTDPVDFTWTGPNGFASSDANLVDLEAGDYVLSVTDGNACSLDSTITIAQNTEIVIDATVTEPQCGTDTGSIDATVSGGTVAVDYTYVWYDVDNGNAVVGNAALLEDIPSGNYQIEVTDDAGCMATLDVAVNDASIGDLTFTVTDVLCNGDANGAIDITLSNFITTYTVAWTGPNGFTSVDEDISDLEAGTYTLTVTDENGCQIIEDIDVNEPEVLDAVAVITDVLCSGAGDGAIEITVSGGTTDYGFSWTGPNGYTSADEDIFDLEGGSYDLTITDANGCLFVQTYDVQESSAIDLTIDASGTLCFGANDGTIDLTIAGGTPDYTILWTGPNGFSSTDEDLTDLAPGSYDLEVTDAAGCIAIDSVVIDENTEITIDIIEVQPTCGETDGSLEAFVSGGTIAVDYGYIWYDLDNGGVVIGNLSIVTDLPSGNYFLEVTDDLGCLVDLNISLSDADAGAVDGIVTDALCFGDTNGAIDITLTDVDGPYTVSWTGPNGFTSSDEDIADLEVGTYLLQVIDANGCELNDAFDVEQPEELLISTTSTDPLCGGELTGNIDATVTGGTEDYIYSWTGPGGFTADTSFIEMLEAGCYDLEVTDANGCLATNQTCLNAPAAIDLSAVITDNLCFGDSLGEIDLSIAGGTPDFTIVWVGPGGFTSDQEDLIELPAGQYDLQVIDGNDCLAETFFIVSSTDELMADATVTPPACPGESTGSIEVVISGGTPDYTVNWTSDNGFTGTGTLITDLEAGNYTATITDSNGCLNAQVIELQDPEPLDVMAAVVPVACNGEDNGSIEIEISGGTEPYQILWTGPNGFNSPDEDIFNLEPGTFDLTVMDDNMCTFNASYEIEEAAPLDVSIENIVNATCVSNNDGEIQINITGGEEPYTITWTGPDGFTSDQEDITDLFEGTYSLDVVDAFGCVFSVAALQVQSLGDVVLTAPADLEACDGETLVLEGSNEGGSEEGWTDLDGTLLSTDSLLSIIELPGTYSYIYFASDNGCTQSDTVNVTIYDLPTADAGDDWVIFPEEQATLGGNPITDAVNDWYWSPGTFLTDSLEANPTTTEIPSDTEFVLYVTSPEGCVMSDTVLVTLVPEIDIPGGFTPNGDGINDFWVIANIRNYEGTTVEVFNRWGDKLFSSFEYNQPWDGKYNGEPLPIGSYYYVINVVEPGYEQVLTGPVTIMR